jgi:hypothetical protein
MLKLILCPVHNNDRRKRAPAKGIELGLGLFMIECSAGRILASVNCSVTNRLVRGKKGKTVNI